MQPPSLAQSLLDTPLNRAHTLSAFADSLPTSSASAEAHTAAAAAFEFAASQMNSEQMKPTILSLAAEHTRQAKLALAAPVAPEVDDTQQLSATESFAILSSVREGDPHDPFARFYNLVNGFMADNQMSNPVAFATAPIASSSAGSTSDEFDFYVVPSSAKQDCIPGNSAAESPSTPASSVAAAGTVRETATNLLGQAAAFIRTASGFAMHGDGSGGALRSKPQESEPDDELDRDADGDGVDFDQPATRACAVLRKENANLKEVIQQLRSRLAQSDKRDSALRNSVLKFSRDMHDETQRMRDSMLILPKSVAALPSTSSNRPVNSASVTAASLLASKAVDPSHYHSLTAPSSSSQPPGTAALRAIISTLETQVARLTAQNEKQRKSLARYEERWNKLKLTSTRKTNLGTVQDDAISAETEIAAMGTQETQSNQRQRSSVMSASNSALSRQSVLSDVESEIQDDPPTQ